MRYIDQSLAAERLNSLFTNPNLRGDLDSICLYTCNQCRLEYANLREKEITHLFKLCASTACFCVAAYIATAFIFLVK